MRKRLVLGTRNPEKVRILRSALARLPVELVDLAELGLDLVVEEDRASLEENAAKKARAYATASGLPALSIDGGLRIEGLPEERQPGVLVRRIPDATEATDEQVLTYYQAEIARLGGEAIGAWSAAAALALPGGRLVTQKLSFRTTMRAERQGQPTPGAPLNCLMVDPDSGRYYSEVALAERPDFAGYREFIAQYLDEL